MKKFVFKQVLWSIRENITNALLKDGYSYKYDISLSLQVFYQIVIDLRKHLKNVADVKTVCGYGHIGKLKYSNKL